MVDAAQYPFCSELDVIDRTIYAVAEVGGENRQIRIEVLKSLVDGHCHTHVYLKEHITAQPSYPWGKDSFSKKPESMSVWVDWRDFPWTHTNTVDQALAQALSFLGDHSTKPT